MRLLRRIAPDQVADKIKQAGAVLLEVAADDLELAGGVVRLKGVPGMNRSIAQIARALGGAPGFALPGGLPPGLEPPRSISSPGQ